MYVPRHFQPPSGDAVTELLSSTGISDLVTCSRGEILCTSVPFLFEPDAGGRGLGALQGHVARANPQWRAEPDGDALVIVHGIDAYVSPSWYASTAEHGRVVPTWNYIAAQVYGRLVVHDDVRWVEPLVRRLTARHEAGIEPPWSPDDAPEEYIRKELKAIVGIEIEISRIEGKWKMSQNRTPEDVEGAAAGLEATGGEIAKSVAGEMRARLSERAAERPTI